MIDKGYLNEDAIKELDNDTTNVYGFNTFTYLVSPKSSYGGNLENLIEGTVSADTENPEFASQPPNELRIIVIQGKDLLPMDTGMFQSGLSDPYVKIKMSGCPTKKTKYLPETLNPVWNEAFTLEQVTDKTRSFEVICYDHDRFR